jgi:hypothetical protein
MSGRVGERWGYRANDRGRDGDSKRKQKKALLIFKMDTKKIIPCMFNCIYKHMLFCSFLN